MTRGPLRFLTPYINLPGSVREESDFLAQKRLPSVPLLETCSHGLPSLFFGDSVGDGVSGLQAERCDLSLPSLRGTPIPSPI